MSYPLMSSCVTFVPARIDISIFAILMLVQSSLHAKGIANQPLHGADFSLYEIEIIDHISYQGSFYILN